MSKAIYRLNFDCQRMGSLQGIFVALKEDVEILKFNAIQIYFGEVLGKHSEVYGPVDDGEIEMVTDDPTAVEIFEKYDLASGYNPFQYTALGTENTVGEEVEKLRGMVIE